LLLETHLRLVGLFIKLECIATLHFKSKTDIFLLIILYSTYTSTNKRRTMDLKTWLQSSGLTVLQLAKELGVTRMTVYNWVNGKPISKMGATLIEVYTAGVVKAEELLKNNHE